MNIPRLSGRGRATLIGGLIVAVGLSASTVLAAEWRSSEMSANRSSFDSTATDLRSELVSRLGARIALTQTIRAIATLELNIGETRFEEWYRELHLGAPALPGVVAVLIRPVPAAGLAAFRRKAEADPAFRRLLGGHLQIDPSGRRAVCCLTKAIVGTASTTPSYPLLLDYCAPVLPLIGRSPYATLIRTGTNTDTFGVTSLPGVGGSLVAIGAPVYRRGVSLVTVAARRAALTGFIGTSFDSGALIRSVLARRRSLTVALYHQNVGAPLQLIARGGPAPTAGAPAYAQRTELDECWMVAISGLGPGSRSADGEGLVVLGLGLIVTLLSWLLYIALSRSRQRAWSLVGEKTEELEYHAMHDPLTGLPNRSLVLDRAEQMLARARRMDVPAIALLMDHRRFQADQRPIRPPDRRRGPAAGRRATQHRSPRQRYGRSLGGRRVRHAG